ncbi:MAG: EAL domain-containing protein, partial [Hyphomonadaceae bacterium]
SLDDFGTGYSSLAYLCNFKFDKIKIDRSFESGVSKDDISKTIIQAVVTLGRGLGMDFVAEGVETEYDAVMMTHFGCNELQGYFFSRPIDADAMSAFITRHRAQPPALVTLPQPARLQDKA